MKIFLDTNVFYNNWFIKNPNFKLMFRYLNNEKEDLLLSNLVIQEVENIRNRELDEATAEIDRQIKKVSKLNSGTLNYDKSLLNIKEYKLYDLVSEHVEYIDRIGYEKVPHCELVERAFISKKPFSGQEKGYRDALIWLSFVDYLVENKIEGKVAFITNNKSDFFTVKGKAVSLHSDLLSDIKSRNIKAEVVPYLNLFDFVAKEIDKDEHLIDKMKLEHDLDSFLLEQTEEYLANLDKNSLSDLLGTNLFKDKITKILDSECDTWDGVDDTSILHVSKLSDTEAYVSCQFIVTGIDLTVSIDEIEYNQHKDEIDSLIECYQVVVDKENEIAKISLGFKAYVSGSLVFNTVIEEPTELNVEDISI